MHFFMVWQGKYDLYLKYENRLTAIFMVVSVFTRSYPEKESGRHCLHCSQQSPIVLH
ncbi:hypothetical protein HanXRQr2_Chr12g0529171 [Helianthus annuus]|nr:hypothetical protein HanXRQr2_Chr12g0529171 [Helianthus annuus]KAJ0861716.1 hypothetical protein HanPSC8_Chr12g0509821 [Helianthus annuus]